MKTEYIVLKETILNNNCPECYSTESLTLSFKQKKLLNNFFVKTKGEVIESMNCKKCETIIFPGRWTDDIERVYDYHKKTISATPTSIKFTGLFYVMLLLSLLILATLYTYLFHQEVFMQL
ncbi:hypothetical protein [Aquimarina sp. 2201CG14-23]|uniref:hypothetical protein n=1 Tax=Aquimarina mycalae TaxID=3040073 RepID=UPI00247808BB|nr:hypothetical protein [Aquimarina sp. 2201CG14-23]MDH7446046.1 hypothetical protein [Aquimarina sp. 2201CG14-23]